MILEAIHTLSKTHTPHSPIPLASLAPQTSPPISQRASIRRMNALLGAPPLLKPKSPSQRFIDAHSISKINEVLRRYRATARDIDLFKRIISEEKKGFLGYQAGSSTVRIFQDLIATVVKDVLKIPMKDDFVFTRVPGDPTFRFEKSSDFINEKGKNIPPANWDTQPEIRQHILSLNMNLYQSYDAPWDLTPRYYLENTTWTQANVKEIIKPLFESLGIKSSVVDELWSQALSLLPHDRGYILQIFDESPEYRFTKEHAYIAYSGGKPHPHYSKHEILFDESATKFPQIRLVMSNESTLNPFSSLSIKRYDNLSDAQRQKYDTSLRSLVEKLSFDPNKVAAARERLLKLWVESY